MAARVRADRGGPGRARRADERPRDGRRVHRPGRRRPRRHRRGPRCSTCARIRRPTASSWSTSTRATASRCRSAVAPSTWHVGDLVPLATLGTVMPSGMKIERRKLRGEWSNGMLCSGHEIGLGDDHAGILILDGDLALGSDLAQALGLEPDVLYDLEINPNRPDAMSVAGVARDLAARLHVPFAIAEPQAAAPSVSPRRASAEIVDAELCGRFYARVLDGITIGPSPAWVANRLRALGMRPINRVVDASNYVMLELGQPNHTYDLDRLAPGPDGAAHLRVRWARDGETLVTLDGVERTLTPADGVIADAADVTVGLAGRHGWRVDRDLRRHHGGAARDGVVGPDDDRPHLQAPQPAQRGLSSVRARHRPRDRRAGRPSLRRAARRGRRPPHRRGRRRAGERRRPGDGAPAHGTRQRGAGHRAHRAPDHRPPAADRLPHRPGGRRRWRRAGRHRAELPARHHHRDRRHRRGRPPPRLQQHRANDAARRCEPGR